MRNQTPRQLRLLSSSLLSPWLFASLGCQLTPPLGQNGSLFKQISGSLKNYGQLLHGGDSRPGASRLKSLMCFDPLPLVNSNHSFTPVAVHSVITYRGPPVCCLLGSPGVPGCRPEKVNTMNMESTLVELIVQRGRKEYWKKLHDKSITANCDKGY